MKNLLFLFLVVLSVSAFGQGMRCPQCPPSPVGHAGEVLGTDGTFLEWIAGGSVAGADNGLTLDGTDVILGGDLIQNTTVECDGNTLQLIETDPAIGTAEVIIINTSPLLRGGFLVRNNNDVGFYAGNTASSGLDALRAQTEVVDGSGVSTGWYAQMLSGVYTTGLRMDNTLGGTTMNFENDANETFLEYDCDNTTLSVGTATNLTEIIGDPINLISNGNNIGQIEENRVRLGDYDQTGNETLLSIDDASETILIQADEDVTIINHLSAQLAKFNANAGTIEFNGSFKYVDGGQDAGLVLTSDASGNASWQPNAAPTISSGAVAPASTPGKIGDLYIDTVAFKLYFAKGTASSADWIIAN